MPSASLSIPATAEHVRTARVVAVAAARRAGLAEEELDDVRLAVGEVVTRAVLLAAANGPTGEVDLVLLESPDSFEVEVTARGGISADLGPVAPDSDDDLALTLVRALVPVVLTEGPVVTLRWSRSHG
jgi:anti-sigma regulatory factor (Ser/Thr protein kinase)